MASPKSVADATDSLDAVGNGAQFPPDAANHDVDRVAATVVTGAPDLAEQVGAHELVHVVLQTTERFLPARTDEEQAQAMMATFGACRDDPSLSAIFEEIDRKRHADMGREVDNIE